MAALTLTGAAVVLEPISGVTALLSRIAALGAFGAADAQVNRVATHVAGLEERVAELERLRVPYRRISGPPLTVLAMCVLRESSTLFDHVDPAEAQTALNLTAQECREAIEDLQDYGLVDSTAVMSKLGFSALFLTGSAYVAAAPSILTGVDVPGELGMVVAQLRSISGESYRLRTTDLLARTSIPAPRMDLMLRSLVERGLIEGQGPGSPEWGSFMTVSLTRDGRRFLRDFGNGAA